MARVRRQLLLLLLLASFISAVNCSHGKVRDTSQVGKSTLWTCLSLCTGSRGGLAYFQRAGTRSGECHPKCVSLPSVPFSAAVAPHFSRPCPWTVIHFYGLLVMSPSGVVVPLLLPPVSDISSLINVLLISSSWQVLIAHGSTYLFQRNSPCPGTRHAVDPGAEGSAGPATFRLTKYRQPGLIFSSRWSSLVPPPS